MLRALQLLPSALPQDYNHIPRATVITRAELIRARARARCYGRAIIIIDGDICIPKDGYVSREMELGDATAEPRTGGRVYTREPVFISVFYFPVLCVPEKRSIRYYREWDVQWARIIGIGATEMPFRTAVKRPVVARYHLLRRTGSRSE